MMPRWGGRRPWVSIDRLPSFIRCNLAKQSDTTAPPVRQVRTCRVDPATVLRWPRRSTLDISITISSTGVCGR